MALNKGAFVAKYKQLLTDMESRSEDAKSELAERMADILVELIKSGTVTVNSGIAVSTSGSATAQTGSTTATGTGTIS